MEPKRLIALALALVLVGAFVVAAPAAQGRRGSGPLASIACKRIAPGVCEESGDVAMPPNSFAAQTTDTVPGSSKEEDTYLQPFNAQELADFDSLWETVADGFPKLTAIKNVTVRRVITCALFARAGGNLYGAFTRGTIVRKQVSGDNANAAILAMCVQAAVTGQQATGAVQGAAAGSHCSTAVVSLPVQISRSGSRYTVTANSSVSRASGPLAVACQTNGNGIVIKLRPRKRGRTLRAVAGPRFGIGYSNHTSRSVRVRATFRFK
ncbi:MAG TPA: hypothetical protein VFF79_01700 [Conexibacter sp.]|jgi:hypothetical protein|nr:hypothetical protein [Conexibacter sp.]